MSQDPSKGHTLIYSIRQRTFCFSFSLDTTKRPRESQSRRKTLLRLTDGNALSVSQSDTDDRAEQICNPDRAQERTRVDHTEVYDVHNFVGFLLSLFTFPTAAAAAYDEVIEVTASLVR